MADAVCLPCNLALGRWRRFVTRLNTRIPLDENETDHFVVIGAGPVGLAIAAKLLLDSSRNSVTVYEKRGRAFTRRNMVRWKPSALPFWHDPRAAYLRRSLRKTMALADIQSVLLQFVTDLGVEWVEEEVKTERGGTLPTHIIHSNTRRVFVTTGSKATLADDLFGRPIDLLAPSTVVTCTAEVDTSGRRGGATLGLLDRYRTQKELPGTAIEVARDGVVTMLMEIQGIDIRSGEIGLTVRSQVTPLEACRIWAGARGDVLRATVKQYKSITFRRQVFTRTVDVVVNRYGGEHVEDMTRDVEVCLAGDAAFGVPYQRSLSNGIQQVHFIGYTLAEYEKSMTSLVLESMTAARATRFGALGVWLGTSLASLSPVSLVSWPREDVERWRTSEEVPGLGSPSSPSSSDDGGVGNGGGALSSSTDVTDSTANHSADVDDSASSGVSAIGDQSPASSSDGDPWTTTDYIRDRGWIDDDDPRRNMHQLTRDVILEYAQSLRMPHPR